MNINEAKMKLYSIANDLAFEFNSIDKIRESIVAVADALEDQMGSAAPVASHVSGSLVLPKPYCVIGASVRTDRVVARTWREQKAEAESHASDLLARVGNEACQELRAVSVVRRRRNHEVIDVEVR